MTSYCQSWAASFTAVTIASGVMPGPDGIFRGSVWPLARTLTLVPPMSMTRTAGIATTLFTRTALETSPHFTGLAQSHKAQPTFSHGKADQRLDASRARQKFAHFSCGRPARLLSCEMA